MPKGGTRTRSGPPKDPNSGRSDRLGFSLTALPSEGYSGPVPDLANYLLAATDRHVQLWTELWSTPQACAWSMQSWRWPQLADLVKYQARDDLSDAPAALATNIRRLRDDHGLTTAGLVANGWAIAADQVAEKRAAKKVPAKRATSRDRMKVVGGDD